MQPAEMPWGSGRLHSSQGPKRLLFGRMYEDPEIERTAFHAKRRIFCIASSGDTALALAPDHEVVACDINLVQLAYARRRAAGAPAICGDVERAMAFARAFAPLAGWLPKTVRAFLALSDTAQQTAFWRKHLDTRRFHTSFDVLLSRPVLRLAYSEQFLCFIPPHFGEVIQRRLRRGFALHPNATNPYARALLLGELPCGVGPCGQPANLHLVSQNGHLPPPNSTPQGASRIEFVHADAAAYLESCQPKSFDGFTLSNILDGARVSYGLRLARAVRRAAAPNSVIVLRSFLEPRPDIAINHAARDRSMLWGVLHIRNACRF
jgi:S-adenosylmethionine:diacylglycerol 3-amino-3-carboxypropyl transferase